jgi:sporulation protein YlmC with PRC-barrel domain
MWRVEMNGSLEKVVEIPVEAEVFGRDGRLGRSTCVVLNPTTDEVTDFVLEVKHPLRKEYLVPRGLIQDVQSDSVQVNLSQQDIQRLKPFYETDCLEVDIPHEIVTPFVIWPYVVPEHRLALYEREMIPIDELAIRRQAKVHAIDGVVGKVDEFMLDLKSGHVSHLVMREGHLWGKKDVMIPVSAIDSMDEWHVYLSISKEQIAALPTIPVRERRWGNHPKKA